MHGKLLLEAFEKVRQDKREEVASKQAAHLSIIIQELSSGPFGERSLRDLRKKALAGEAVRLKDYVAVALCRYLEYDSIEAYYEKHEIKIDPSSEGSQGQNDLRRIALAAILVIGVGLGIWWIQGEGPNRAMVWDGDEFKEVPIDVNAYAPNELHAYSEEKISNLKKIKTDCNTPFFGPRGEALLFYGKNAKGELEFFTALARHPETGKSLKEVTPYMIRKYICETY